MRGLASSVTPLEAGVRSDFEALLAKFVEVPSVRFQHFANIFKDMKISLICRNRPSEGELREFVEKTLRLALSFALPPYSFQARVGGLYLLYGVFFTQVAEHRSKIRIVHDEYHQLLLLVQDLTTQHHYDACFVFHKLVREHAFVFCRFTEEHNPLTYHRIENPYDTDRITEDLKAERAALQDLLDDPLIQQLSTVHDNYYAMKCQLNGVDAVEPTPALGLITENPAEIIQNVMKDCQERLQRKVLGTKKKAEAKPNVSKPVNRRAAIKAKAFSSIPEGPAHRRSKANRYQSSTEDSLNDSSALEGTQPIQFARNDILEGARKRRRNSKKTFNDKLLSDTSFDLPDPASRKKVGRPAAAKRAGVAGGETKKKAAPRKRKSAKRSFRTMDNLEHEAGGKQDADDHVMSTDADLEDNMIKGEKDSVAAVQLANSSFDMSSTDDLDDEVTQIDAQVSKVVNRGDRSAKKGRKRGQSKISVESPPSSQVVNGELSDETPGKLPKLLGKPDSSRSKKRSTVRQRKSKAPQNVVSNLLEESLEDSMLSYNGEISDRSLRSITTDSDNNIPSTSAQSKKPASRSKKGRNSGRTRAADGMSSQGVAPTPSTSKEIVTASPRRNSGKGRLVQEMSKQVSPTNGNVEPHSRRKTRSSISMSVAGVEPEVDIDAL